MSFRGLLVFLIARLPGGPRGALLRRFFGYEVHPNARIGLSLIDVDMLLLEERASIGHLNVIRGLNRLVLEEGSEVGPFNWINCVPLGDPTFFTDTPERDPSLVMKREATITNRHLFDCSERITIGEFSGIGGFRSTIMTHSIDLRTNRQVAHPITIGDRSFVATCCTILGGAALPEYSALAAGSVLRGAHEEPGLYSGVPAKRVADMSTDNAYFRRQVRLIT